MARRKLLLVVGVAVIAAAVIGTTLASGSSQPASAKKKTLTIYSEATATNVDVDKDGKSSAGDLLVGFTTNFDRQGGTKIGTGSVVCTVIDPTTNYLLCQGSDALPGGDIFTAAEGTLGATATAAVVGGTENYRNVRGQATVTFLNQEGTQFATTYELIGVGS